MKSKIGGGCSIAPGVLLDSRISTIEEVRNINIKFFMGTQGHAIFV